MRSIYKISVLIIMLICSANSCEQKILEVENVLLQDMANFDKAFIPVLYYVRQGEMDNAKKSVFFLNHAWQKFQGKYKNAQPENDNWQEIFRMTDAWLSDAYFSIEARMPQDAYIFLDHVRYQLMEFRRQEQLNYFLDNVWEFEASLDLAEEVAVDQMLCLLDYGEFEKLVEMVNQDWTKLNRPKNIATLFELDEAKMKILDSRKQKLKFTLLEFNQAVEEAEGENLAITATFFKQAYLDYLACFGDFISSKHYYATL
ncbi:MAG: hypothetical protein AB8H03_08045 [Saprospiraceae bacterium]